MQSTGGTIAYGGPQSPSTGSRVAHSIYRHRCSSPEGRFRVGGCTVYLLHHGVAGFKIATVASPQVPGEIRTDKSRHHALRSHADRAGPSLAWRAVPVAASFLQRPDVGESRTASKTEAPRTISTDTLDEAGWQSATSWNGSGFEEETVDCRAGSSGCNGCAGNLGASPHSF
jgi:hypothetical protein